MHSQAMQQRCRRELEHARQQAVSDHQGVERACIARTRRIAERLQRGQRDPGGEREVELGREVPPAEVRAFVPPRTAGALHHAGQQRARHHQVGRESDAAGHADGRIGRDVARAEAVARECRVGRLAQAGASAA